MGILWKDDKGDNSFICEWSWSMFISYLYDHLLFLFNTKSKN